MAVKYSLDLNQQICPERNKTCKACGLYLNQLPAFSFQKQSQVFWLGLSAVQFKNDDEKQPLSPNTRSGALIEKIEQPFSNEISFYKTNLVKCLPLKNEKIRYPLEHEMLKCFPNFQHELDVLKPSLVFLLGKQVASFISKQYMNDDVDLNEEFNYSSFMIGNIKFVPVHHPSYILVYRRKYLNNYIEGIQNIFSTFLYSALKYA
jgi:uracil-DNA glycosylase